jgi:adenosyl cobinamide kinase/adenosyl cobinamide phosphate guanylyltransferase
MGTLTVLLGGARSGKSTLAVQWGRRHAARGGAVVFVATAPDLDDDMRRRIERHRVNRPGWPTVEELHDLPAAVAGHDDALVIVDCLTLWVSNLVLRGDDDGAIVELAERSADAFAARSGPTVVITNEVGMGIHPDNELGRRYRDVLGYVNQAFVARAGQSLLLVAGHVLPLHPSDEFSV